MRQVTVLIAAKCAKCEKAYEDCFGGLMPMLDFMICSPCYSGYMRDVYPEIEDMMRQYFKPDRP